MEKFEQFLKVMTYIPSTIHFNIHFIVKKIIFLCHFLFSIAFSAASIIQEVAGGKAPETLTIPLYKAEAYHKICFITSTTERYMKKETK